MNWTTERQQQVWDIADNILSAADLLKVTMILTLGTDEAHT
jgi:hypothetical protein